MAGQGDRLEQYKVELKKHAKLDDCDHPDQPAWVRRKKKSRRLPAISKPMRFTSLHHHSTYSYLDGYQVPQAHARRAAELEMQAIAMTEHGNVSSHVPLEIACTKKKDKFGHDNPAYGMKPIFGVELYCGEVGENATQAKNHLTILAKDQEGYSNLLKLVGKTYSQGFHYHPTASGSMLEMHRRGLYVLSGCLGSLLATSAIGGKHIPEGEASLDRARRVAARFKRAFGDAYYIEVQAFPELEQTNRLNPMLAQIAHELDIPLVASLDCHYTLPEEKELQQVLHNIRGGGKQTLEEQARDWGYATDLCPPLTDMALLRKLMATGISKDDAIKAILATEEIGQDCNVVIPQLPMLRFPLPSGEVDSISFWRKELERGWDKRGLGRLSEDEQTVYRRRLDREAKVIEDKDFIDYFLIVSDVVKMVKGNDQTVGPARGSAAGSLVCWLLEITEVNPLRYPNLIFERFIDETREDLPDIDLDFPSEFRQDIVQYLAKKYGRESVNNIGTFTTWKAPMALDDAARVYGIPRYKVDSVKDVLIERSSGDLRASATIEDTVDQFDVARNVFEENPELGIAMELEGNVKGFGVHAAGVVISNGPVTDVCAVYERTVNDQLYKVVSLDKYSAEEKGLLKIDLLGLKNMSFIDACRKEIGWSLADLYDYIYSHDDDPVVIDAFRRNDVVGVFQFDGRACRYVCGALAPDTFMEICDITALARPGPLHNGAANEYIEIKRGNKEPEEMHPALAAITKETYYQIVYQEQILRIVVEIGQFDWTHAAEIRRIISRKHGEQAFNRKRDDFLRGASTLHKRTDWPEIDPEEARRIWGDCITSGAYAFNASHSISYGTIGFWAQRFKQYDPELYFYMGLRHMADKKHTDLIRDAVRGHGPRKKIQVLPPSPEKAEVTWTQQGPGAIRAGFAQVDGVGPKVSAAIAEYMGEHEVKDWADLSAIKGIGPKTIVKMQEFAESDDPFGALWLDRAIAEVKRAIFADELGSHIPRPTHTSQDIPYSQGRDIEVAWLGMVHTRNVRDLFEYNRAKGEEIIKDEEGVYWIPDRKGGRKRLERPDLNEWMVMVGDDEHDQMGLRVDRYKYPKFRSRLWNMRLGKDLILVRGYKPGFLSTRQIWVTDMWIIDPE
jgi:DNA polymerase III subunit alpha